MKKIIAICGAKRSGKDILANHIVNKYGYTRLSFAEPLKELVKLIFNFSDEQVGLIDGDNEEKDTIDERWGISPRKALQFIGTEVLQHKIQELIPNIGRDYFANILLSKIENDKTYVISDLRFIHEYEKIKHLDIDIIKVIRPSLTTSKEGEQNNVQHLSEIENLYIPYNKKIINDGTQEDYINKFENL
tara:strand:+ start:2375 stop:2941 length:567 start_codon:yes stop_codon:yes gene_type:complete